MDDGIPEAVRHNFDQLRIACVREDAVLLQAKRRADNAPVYLICATNVREEQMELVPLGELITGDPYALYEPPADVDDDGVDEISYPADRFPATKEDAPGLTPPDADKGT